MCMTHTDTTVAAARDSHPPMQVQGGGNATAAAQALSTAVGTAIATAYASASAKTTVQGDYCPAAGGQSSHVCVLSGAASK